jgi:hypothetical protein
MTKIFGIIIALVFTLIFALQAEQVLAKQGENDNDRPVSGPITSPLTSPLCKPGWGFGDKNHCHSGPPGQEKDNHVNNSHH